MSPRPSHTPRNAFSLVELTVALALVGLGVVATLGIMGIAASSSSQSRVETHAVFLADNLFEDLRRLHPAQAPPSPPLPIHPDFSLALSSTTFSPFDLYYDATLLPVPADSPDRAYVATVEGRPAPTGPEGPTLVTITVSSPALAAPEDRWRRTFASLLSFQR